MYFQGMNDGERVRVGALIPTREATLSGASAGSLIEFARAAEREGFDSVWAGDSLTARPRLEPLTLLAGVALACPRVAVGTAALNGALRNPLLLAHAIATVDQLSGGRLVLGLGAGFPTPDTHAEFVAAGADFERRVGRLDEAVRVWRALWDPDRDPSQPLRFEGRYSTFDGIERLPRPHRPGGPPLWLAGGGERALRRAGRLYDGWLPYPPAADAYARGLAVARAAGEKAGRDPNAFIPALYVTINVQPDAAAGRAELERYVLDYYGAPLEMMAALQAFHAGDIDECTDWLRGFVDAGARHIVIRFGSFDGLGQLKRAAGPLLEALKR